MSDKKEIATLSIKISVDSTDLDNLEAQLKRIAGLMVDAGLKEPTRGGCVSDSFSIFTPSSGKSDPVFFVENGRVFINDTLIHQAPTFKFKASIHYNDTEESAIANLDNAIAEIKEVDAAQYIEELSTKFTKHDDNSIDNHAPNLNQEVEALKEEVAAILSEKEQERASIASLQQAIAESNHAQAEAIRQLAIDMQRSRSGFC